MPWNFPLPQSMDIRSDGKIAQTLVPAATEQTVEYKITATKAAAANDYKRVAALCGRLRTVFDQAAAGGSVVNWDELFRVIGGLPIDSPTFGQIIDHDSSIGPVLKHLIEFMGNDYRYAEGARAQIAAADGDTTVDLYFSFPFAQRNFTRPADMMPWLGWLENTIAKFCLATSTTIASVSTGAVIKATTTVQMWLDYVVDKTVDAVSLPYWRLFKQAATGGTTFLLSNVGANDGWKKMQEWIRLAGIFLLSSNLGMGGTDTADNITAFQCERLEIDRIENIDALVRKYKAMVGGHAGPTAGIGATTPVHDNASNPETMAATPNATLNSSTLGYLPLLAAGRQTQMTKLPLWKGDLLMTFGFTSAPSSGEHRAMVYGIRALTRPDAEQLLAQAGCKPQGRAFAGNAPGGAHSEKRFVGIPFKGVR
jgi:hypothetical protein